MYIEASGKKAGQKSRLVSPSLTMSGDTCVLFYYHMYGKSTGKLNVYAQVNITYLYVHSLDIYTLYSYTLCQLCYSCSLYTYIIYVQLYYIYTLCQL